MSDVFELNKLALQALEEDKMIVDWYQFAYDSKKASILVRERYLFDVENTYLKSYRTESAKNEMTELRGKNEPIFDVPVKRMIGGK